MGGDGVTSFWKNNGKEAAYFAGRGVWGTFLQETLVRVLGTRRG